MSRYIRAELRQLVTLRANNRCEYCFIHEQDTFLGCEVDHIIRLKHGGETEETNLALACFICNRKKGTDIGSLSEGTGELIRFFNPRKDLWEEHFFLEGPIINTKTEIGLVTAKILDFNHPDRILERQVLINLGRYSL